MTQSRSTSLARACAIVLALLIVLPFTAPFSSCPLSLLSGDHGPVSLAGVVAARDSVPSDGQSMITEEQLKDDVAVLSHQEFQLAPARFVYRSLVLRGAVAPTLTPLVLRL